MTQTPLQELLNSHLIQCRGADNNQTPILPKDLAEPVIVKVYKDGKTEPLCRYLKLGSTTICNAGEEPGRCIYT